MTGPLRGREEKAAIPGELTARKRAWGWKERAQRRGQVDAQPCRERPTRNAIPTGRRRDVGMVTKLLVKRGGERKGRDKKRGKKKKALHVKAEEMLWELQPGAFFFFFFSLLPSCS